MGEGEHKIALPRPLVDIERCRLKWQTMATGQSFIIHVSKSTLVSLICKLSLSASDVNAQQFNSDSWLSKPHGTVTIIPTAGERNFMLMTTYSLFPKWEFTIAAYLYNNDGDPLTDDGYSASLYGKYMFYQNKAGTGGASVKAGTGMRPGTINGEDRT